MIKRIAMLTVGLGMLMGVVACDLPESIYIDYNGDGTIDADERKWRETTLANAVIDARKADAARSAVHPQHNHPTLRCIRRHESDTSGGYTAQNRVSSASGAYQFIDGTWRTMSKRAGHGGASKAKYASPYVQDAVAWYTLQTVGSSPWAGSGC